MAGAHYEAEVERDGINVRVVVDLTGDAVYNDMDEIGELIGSKSVQVLQQIVHNRINSVPF
jgi:hypothetical protein